MKVCEKVRKKGTTSYNEVADELVAEFTNPSLMTTPTDQVNIKNVIITVNGLDRQELHVKSTIRTHHCSLHLV
jgi:hypothetical protein